MDVCRGGEHVHGRPANGEEVGGPVPRRKAGRDGRPVLTPRPLPVEDTDPGGAPDRDAALAAPFRARYRSPAGSPCRPRPCTPSWSGCRINRLSRIDRVTGEPLRRYEHDHPGSLIHVDVTKFGNIPDVSMTGGWRYVGKHQGNRNKTKTASRTGRTATGHPNIGTAFVHTVIDDRSRVAYAGRPSAARCGLCRELAPSTALR